MTRSALLVVWAALLLATPARAYVLHQFDPGDNPESPVAVAPDRSVYGTTLEGGTGNGTVYRLAPAAAGMPSTYQAIYSFSGGTDGDRPIGRLVLGADGTVYGVTQSGGVVSGHECPVGCGTVFSLTPPPQGQTVWTKTTLTAFAASPTSGLLQGPNGALLGTLGGGPGSGGVVYQLSPPASGQGAWSYGVVFQFHQNSVRGTEPTGELTMNHVGDIIGTTSLGGTILTGNEYCGQGCGTVYSLHPPQDGAATWGFRQIYALQPADGYYPQLGATEDGHGALYMITTSERDATTNLLKLVNPADGQMWTASTVHAFPTGKNDGMDADGLANDGRGNVYGITLGGGTGNQQVGSCGSGYDGCGTLFEVVPGGVTILLTEAAPGGTAPRYLSASGAHVYLTNSADGPGTVVGTILRLKPGD